MAFPDPESMNPDQNSDLFPAGQLCSCGSGQEREEVRDGRGIFVCYCCDRCRTERLRHYRKDILEQPYTQEDVSEPIEPD